MKTDWLLLDLAIILSSLSIKQNIITQLLQVFKIVFSDIMCFKLFQAFFFNLSLVSIERVQQQQQKS